jgi:hypothetical protein
MEAEYIAASKAAKEAIWIRNFISELGVIPNASSPMDLYCDNSGAITKQRSLGHTRGSSTYYDVTISSVKSLVEVM